MKFHEYPTLFSVAQKVGLPNGEKAPSWYTNKVLTDPHCNRNAVTLNQFIQERDWLVASAPYYSVYPLALASLVKLPLDLDCSLIHLPMPTLLARFAVGHELDTLGDGTRMVRSILAAECETDLGRGLCLWVDFGDRERILNLEGPVLNYRVFSLEPGVTVEAAMAKSNQVMPDETEREDEAVFIPCVRLISTLCLLGDDPSLIQPDVLDRDRAAYAERPRPEIIARAHRRGKIGWLVGSTLTVDPHYRRPHMALRWAGEGRAVPRIVAVKGAVIHRRKMTDVPTGFLESP